MARVGSTLDSRRGPWSWPDRSTRAVLCVLDPTVTEDDDLSDTAEWFCEVLEAQ